MQQRAFAHAGRADDRDHLALLDREIQIAQHVQALGSDLIALVDVGGGEEGHAGRLRLREVRRLHGDTAHEPDSPKSRTRPILVSFHLIVDGRRAAADGRARERALLAADQRADARARASRAADQQRALLPRPPRLHFRRDPLRRHATRPAPARPRAR